MTVGPYMVVPPELELPDAGTQYIQLQRQLALITEAQSHAVLLHHDRVAGLLTQRYNEILGKMGEIDGVICHERLDHI